VTSSVLIIVSHSIPRARAGLSRIARYTAGELSSLGILIPVRRLRKLALAIALAASYLPREILDYVHKTGGHSGRQAASLFLEKFGKAVQLRTGTLGDGNDETGRLAGRDSLDRSLCFTVDEVEIAVGRSPRGRPRR